MTDIRLALMCGTDIPIPQCQLTIHQPTIKEISFIGENDFFTGVQTFCVNKSMLTQDKSILENTTNFQIFMTIMSERETLDKRQAVQQIVPLFFPNYQAKFTPRSMILMGDNLVTIDETNFDLIQPVISEICCLRSGLDQNSFNPGSDKAKEIAEKLMRGRARVAEINGQANASIFSQYLSILTVGLESMSLQDLMNLSIFQLYDLMERYSLYVNWDMDVRSRLAGGKPDSKPDNWMKNIH